MTTSTGTVLLLGGRSEIGLELTGRLVGDGYRRVVLAARRSTDLAAEEAQLRAAGATDVVPLEFDADDLGRHEQVLGEALQAGHVAVAVLAFGVLGDQQRAERDAAHAVAVVHTDYVAQVSVLTHLARLMRAQGSGRIVVFSSVAGVRVRRANYVYGSAKAGLDGFASGLADALHGSGVRLVLVRPGFVIGRMTAGMSPAPLSSTPSQVADAVVAAYDFSDAGTIVDVGGSEGRLLATILRANPTARGILFDLPHVIDRARGRLEASDVSDRCEAVAGDFFRAVPDGGDVYLLAQILHDWDDERSTTILRNCHRAMRPGGKILVVELVIPPGNEPSFGKWLDLHMLVLLTGRERTEAEYGELFSSAGFRLTRVIPTESGASIVEGVKQ